MQRWSRPIAAGGIPSTDDAARARTIRAVMTEASTLRMTDVTERRRAQLARIDREVVRSRVTKSARSRSNRDGAHVAVCLWRRSEPVQSGDDAAATELMRQLQMT